MRQVYLDGVEYIVGEGGLTYACSCSSPAPAHCGTYSRPPSTSQIARVTIMRKGAIEQTEGN